MDFVNLEDLINKLESSGIKTEVEFKDNNKIKYLTFSINNKGKEEKIKINSGNLEIQKQYEISSNILPGKRKKVYEARELKIIKNDTILLRYYTSISENGSIYEEKTHLILFNYDKNKNKINIFYKELNNGNKKPKNLEDYVDYEIIHTVECEDFVNKCSEFLKYVDLGYKNLTNFSLKDGNKIDLEVFNVYKNIIRSAYNLSIILEMIKNNKISMEKVSIINKTLLEMLKVYGNIYEKIINLKNYEMAQN